MLWKQPLEPEVHVTVFNSLGLLCAQAVKTKACIDKPLVTKSL